MAAIGRREFVAILPLLALRPARPARAGAELEKLILQLMRQNSVPGVSIAVVKGGRLAWRHALGVRDVQSGTPVDHDTIFEAASVSKTVFAYAALQLCDLGALGLDTPLTKYTPERLLDDARVDLITTRQVLSHTSGLPNWRSRDQPLRIAFTPSDRYSYSGEGYFYLQSVLTRLKGKSDPQSCSNYEAGLRICATDIDAYLQANLLRPFGMASSGYVWNDTFARHAARPHDAAGKPLAKGRPSAIDAARYAAAGGLHTTATDYATFLLRVIAPQAQQALQLSAATRREMLRPQVKVDASTSWGLGWQIRHTPRGDLIQHQGGQRGFQAFTSASAERQCGYVILTNSDNGWKIFSDERFSEAMNQLLFG